MEQSCCIYCSALADSREHPLPAAFGQFRDAPYLRNRVCAKCNNTRLGVLDEQYARCGPEAFLRRFYGVRGRASHESVNVFERGSAGGSRVDLRAKDEALGIDVALEIENGTARQMRHTVFVEQSGKTHHLPIREGSTPEQLLAAFAKLGVVQPCKEVRIFYDPEEEVWVNRLIQQTWSSATFGESCRGSTVYKGAVGTVGLSDRYFRAIAKIGFHYFLTQFSTYTGHEPLFSDVRRFILEDGRGVDLANDFIGKRQRALLGEMLTPGTCPDGWQSHVLCAEIRPGECLAYVQMFISEDWPAPTYAVRLAHDQAIIDCRAAGHAYIYYGNTLESPYAGEALSLDTTRADWPDQPFEPVITPSGPPT